MRRVGLIGCGRWGVNIKRVLEARRYKVIVHDPAFDSAPIINTVRDVDRVCIASPPQYHAEHAALAIEYGVPFFVEKPLAIDVIDAARIGFLASHTGLQGAVGHIGVHTDSYRKHKKLKPTRVQIIRLTDTAGYHGVTAWWDIGVHDVAVCVDLYGRPDTIHLVESEDTYRAELAWSNAEAVLIGDRTGGKRWDFNFDGHRFTPYDDKTEPLATQIDWWLKGGSNLDDAVTVVETLSRG